MIHRRRVAFPHPRLRSRFRAAGLAVLLTAALGGTLAGCTGTGPSPAPSTAGSQSVADACAVVASSVQDATAELQALDAGDPQAAAESMSNVAASIGAGATAVDNADVAAVLPGLESGFTAAAEALQAIAGGDLSQLPALQQATADIQASLRAFSDLCGAG